MEGEASASCTIEDEAHFEVGHRDVANDRGALLDDDEAMTFEEGTSCEACVGRSVAQADALSTMLIRVDQPISGSPPAEEST